MSASIYRAGRAVMRCWCEVFLCGGDRQNLAAVAESALDEITRVERMLSRFNPASEVFRLNAAPVNVPFRTSPELFAVLQDCHVWWTQTGGAFNVTIQSMAHALTGEQRWNAIHFDKANNTITRSIDGITFDFGGYGKGYAIDRALAVAQQYGIESACLHAGTSSVVASGPPPDANGWPIAIRHHADESQIVAEWSLCHAGMSTSAVAPLTPHDVIDPAVNKPLDQPASCTVIATSAAIAEVWSTALLVRNESTCADANVQRVLVTRRG